jgi:DNA-binding response OmpR family regulator
MSAAVRILFVGNSTASTDSTLKTLARYGWESHAVKTAREAGTVLRTIRFQLTLATEKLPDGTGYELVPLIARQSGTLFVSVPLSETCLWLPAVENGVRSLGQRVLNPGTLAIEASSILRACDAARARLENSYSDGATSPDARIRLETLPARAAIELTETGRFGRQIRERHDYGEHRTAAGTSMFARAITPGAARSLAK